MNDAQKIILMGKADELLAEAERVNETPTHIVRASALMGAEWMQNELQAKYALDLAIDLDNQKYELIEKACEWLRKELRDIDDVTLNKEYGVHIDAKNALLVDELIYDFKQAMKGE